MSFFGNLFHAAPQINKEELLAQGAKVIDVRTEGEFQMGHAPGTINIPMHKINQYIDQLRQENKPLIFICASGNRSGQVVNYLKRTGFTDVYNGGSWISFR